MKNVDKKENNRKKSASAVLKNQIFLWKLCFKTAPWYMIYHLYDAFRYQGIIFLEHVLGIRYVLRCAEFQEPFSKALFYIGLILLLNILQIIVLQRLRSCCAAPAKRAAK